MVNEKKIFAIVTTDKEKIITSSAPVILARDENEQQKIVNELDRIILGRTYKLSNGVVLVTYN